MVGGRRQALLCAWLQPWQGATLVVVLATTELVLWRRDRNRPDWRAGVPLVAGVVPLIYYQLLGHFDSAWQLAGKVNRVSGVDWWLLPIFLLPIVAIALFEYLRPAPTYQDIALRLWLVAGVLLFEVSTYTSLGTYPPHFFQGLSIPIAIMTVRVLTGVAPGWRHTVALAALTAVLIVCVGVRVVREVGSQVAQARVLVSSPLPHQAGRGACTPVPRPRPDERRRPRPPLPRTDRPRSYRATHLGGDRLVDAGADGAHAPRRSALRRLDGSVRRPSVRAADRRPFRARRTARHEGISVAPSARWWPTCAASGARPSTSCAE